MSEDVICDVIGRRFASLPQTLNFPWRTVMCDATRQVTGKSRENHKRITEDKLWLTFY